MGGRNKRFRKLNMMLVVYLLTIMIMPFMPLSHSVAMAVPQVQVPAVSIPEVHVPQSPDVPQVEAAVRTAPKAQALGAKDVVKKAVRMTLGGREVIYKAAVEMDEIGGVKQGGWKTASSYAIKTISPWIDLVAFDSLQLVSDGAGLLGQGKHVKQAYSAYKAIKNSAAAGASTAAAAGGSGRILGAGFPILGGTIGILTGTIDIIDSLADDSQQNEAKQTAKFYSGIASTFGGAGAVLGGVAAIAAGTAAAPALALAGTVLLAAGLVFGAVAFGLKHSSGIRNSRAGRTLSGFKKWLGGQL